MLLTDLIPTLYTFNFVIQPITMTLKWYGLQHIFQFSDRWFPLPASVSALVKLAKAGNLKENSRIEQNEYTSTVTEAITSTADQ